MRSSINTLRTMVRLWYGTLAATRKTCFVFVWLNFWWAVCGVRRCPATLAAAALYDIGTYKARMHTLFYTREGYVLLSLGYVGHTREPSRSRINILFLEFDDDAEFTNEEHTENMSTTVAFFRIDFGCVWV